MRLDTDSPTSKPPTSRGFSNGATLSPLHKHPLPKSTNGDTTSHQVTNGSSELTTNGSVSTADRSLQYFGHDRDEVTRMLIQSLHDLGYNEAAGALTRESGLEVESPVVGAFRSAILHGEWTEAETLLSDQPPPDSGGGVRLPTTNDPAAESLLLADGADRTHMVFLIRRQKFLELLESRDLGSALMVLRHQLTPLNQDVGQLHSLSSLIMCQSAEDLKYQSEWDGAAGQSRANLLHELSNSISPSVMIPKHRLATLLDQIKQNQISNCLYHNTESSPSLFSDHRCEREQFPLESTLALERHTDEVLFLEFSHDGSRLATSSKDRTAIIYSVPSFEVLQVLADHDAAVVNLKWSPDDSKVISCSQDHKARMWDTRTGALVLSIDHFKEPVTTCSWAPDGKCFVTGSLDKQLALCVWNLDGERIHCWSGEHRIQDCCITPDGRRLVAISTERRIYVYDFHTRDEEYSITLKVDFTCVSVSLDSRYILVSMSDSEIQLLDIETVEVVRRFKGHKQGNFIIHSVLGGAGENFVISGSEDSRVYIWHREHGTLLETLSGHKSGCVNAVAWNPHNPRMFATAGDDHKVRIWTNPQPATGRWVGDANGAGR
ncbi:MAG: hypothetical protein M1817_000596 [Caeruleum heppii]|nr:MAG: hypothetical protein M1817_000596 [Caeruleum heppii]